MTERHPRDFLYLSILAEAYAMKGDQQKAVQLFDSLVREEVRQHNTRSVHHIIHRAFCVECFKPIRGIRVKCVAPDCGYGDRCIPCLHGRPDARPHPCVNHNRIQIPSEETLNALRFTHAG